MLSSSGLSHPFLTNFFKAFLLEDLTNSMASVVTEVHAGVTNLPEILLTEMA